MSDIELTNKVPLDELQQTKEYARLMPKQQLWVSTYIQSGTEHGDYNAILATRTAYNCKSEENARIMSYSVMANIHVIEVLNLHFRTEPIDAFLKTIDKAIANKKLTSAQVQVLKMKCDLLGIKNSLPNSAAAAEEEPEKKETKPKKPRKKPEKPPVKLQLPDSSPYGF